jgi:phospholipase/lecithinase/hemolysin
MHLPEPESDQFSLLAVGSTFTIGAGVDPEHRWVTRLVERLRDRGFAGAETHLFARELITAPELWAQFQQASANTDVDFDVVTLQVGGYDAVTGSSPEMFRRSLRKLIDRAIGVAGGETSRVIVMTLADHTEDAPRKQEERERIRQLVSEYNAIIREEATDAGVQLAEYGAFAREAKAKKGVPAGYALTASNQMHRIWSEQMADLIVELVEASGD